MSRLLLEIGTEAIPAGYVPPALKALEENARKDLEEKRLPGTKIRTLGTAKRLVLEIENLPDKQEDMVREVQGPRLDVAFRDGKPTPAAEGFARKNGIDVNALERVASEKGEFVMARVHEKGKDLRDLVPALVSTWIEELPWPKTMIWNQARFRFPRPIRWLVCILDGDVLPLEVAAITADRNTRGHWLLGPGEKRVADSGKLEEVLAEAGVVLDPALRRESIEAALIEEAKTLEGTPVDDPGLLDEVVFLAEHPTVLSGKFDREFLDLPREVVVTAMRAHQRYFAVEDSKGNLLPNFLVVTDGEWEDPKQVIAGNERVLRARLSDARFYWEVDLKTGLDALSESLANVVWLESVGTLKQKIERVTAMVDRLGREWFPDEWPDLKDDVLRASKLAKADLASEMIKDGKEFTGLQGVIGARYAEAAGENKNLTTTLSEQYLPRGAGDPLPESRGGLVLSFADRLDTVTGCWSAGFVPSGSQDPYALRRAANGMIRILMEKNLHTDLSQLVEASVARLPDAIKRDDLAGEVLAFLTDRTAFFLRERGITYDVVDAVLGAEAHDPLDALSRATALNAIRADERLERLVIGFKRAANILKGIDEETLPDPHQLDWSGTEKAEQGLHKAVLKAEKALTAARKKKDYPAMLKHLLELRGPIDKFFDDVLVMTDNNDEKNRRLALLAEARELFHHFFDPARIVIEGEAAK